MNRLSTSIAMTADVAELLRAHLDRPDGQEDICLATYRPSTGATRRTALITSVVAPEPGERHVHGNASIEGDYVIRAAVVAQARGDGLALCHSHPRAQGWQGMSRPDRDAESSFANLVRELTGFPLVGMTYASGDDSWSARHWDTGAGTRVSPTHSMNVRVIGDTLRMSWNDALSRSERPTRSQRRSVSCWGDLVHADLTRRRVLVVGVGSVGLDVAVRLAATGMLRVGVMDFDAVKVHNLDRLIGATPLDAALGRAKADVARRLMTLAATARKPSFEFYEHSICEPEGQAAALDYDVIVSCVDSPWARGVLNQIAYADLIPVIDGGIGIDVFEDGGMRAATWRTHVIGPGRPCLVCSEQVSPTDIALDIQGLLDDAAYVAGAGRRPDDGQNVALLSVSVTASLLAQFVSLNVGVGGIGAPGPLQYHLSTHALEHLAVETGAGCAYEARVAVGDSRQQMTGTHAAAEAARVSRVLGCPQHRLTRLLQSGAAWLESRAEQRSRRFMNRHVPSADANCSVDLPS